MGHEIYPVLKGSTLFRKGELVYINKSSELEEYCNVMHRHDFIEIAEDITSSFLFQSLFPDDHPSSPDLKLQGTEFHEIGDLFSRMYSEYRLMKKGYCDIIRAYLIELIVKIFRNLQTDGVKTASLKNRNLVDSAITYLKQNYNSDIRLDDLAMKSFISKNYFSRLFKEVTGINFSDYVQKLRVDQACSLLKNTDMKVTDIAYQAGFKDMKLFYDVFKKITGKTPGDYRKR